MKLTNEQFKALAPYQSHFETAVNASWSRHPGSSALDLIHSIYNQVSGTSFKLNKGCQHCVMNLMRDMGVIFLADLEERRKVDVAESETPTPIKAEVKTKRKYTRKPKTEE